MKSDMELCRAGNEREFCNLNERLDKIEVSMDKIEEAKADKNLSNLSTKIAVLEERVKNLESKIEKIDGNWKWIVSAGISLLAMIIALIKSF
jgi:predicted  nucleic acid-binding Zn-ribbon protein